jgi:hypothetical protein
MNQNTGRNITQAIVWGTAILVFFRLPILSFLLIGVLITWSFRHFWLKLALAWVIFLVVLLAGYELHNLLF